MKLVLVLQRHSSFRSSVSVATTAIGGISNCKDVLGDTCRHGSRMKFVSVPSLVQATVYHGDTLLNEEPSKPNPASKRQQETQAVRVSHQMKYTVELVLELSSAQTRVY